MRSASGREELLTRLSARVAMRTAVFEMRGNGVSGSSGDGHRPSRADMMRSASKVLRAVPLTDVRIRRS